jgi:hypothetical protein
MKGSNVKFITGLNSFNGLKAQNSTETSLGVSMSTEQLIYKPTYEHVVYARGLSYVMLHHNHLFINNLFASAYHHNHLFKHKLHLKNQTKASKNYCI